MIFNLFKSKPTLKELIPNGFVDIHSHILPGIDDGAKNIKESVILISEMKKMGFSKIIGTPHTFPGLYNNSNISIKESFAKIENNDIKIEYASEYLIDTYLIKKAENKSLLCLKNNYVLVEMSFNSEPINLFDVIFHLQINGYQPILAHPERYLFLHNNISKYHKLKDLNVKFQLNLLSLTGQYGEKILKFSEKLIENNLIDFMGSDIHNLFHINNFNKNIQTNKTKKLDLIFEQNQIFK